jgi:tRNA A37 threonylcarbamoyladenosine synthetase subunit TsaC/SUA5/YrdC
VSDLPFFAQTITHGRLPHPVPAEPAVAEDFATLAWGTPDHELMDRLHSRVGLLPARGACRHPDGASRLAATALHAFADDVHCHLRGGPCAAANEPATVTVPDLPGPEQEGWR